METTREVRFSRGKVELRKITDVDKSAGYIGAVEGFIRYNSDSTELRDKNGNRFIERLLPGVFARTLANAAQAIFADVGHNDAATFAKRGVNLTFIDSASGLSYRALVPATTVGNDLLTNVRLGIIDGTSFEFEAQKDECSKRGELVVRTIREALLCRVNPVTEPAYCENTLAVRGLEEFCRRTQVPNKSFADDPREIRLRIFTK